MYQTNAFTQVLHKILYYYITIGIFLDRYMFFLLILLIYKTSSKRESSVCEPHNHQQDSLLYKYTIV